MLIQCTNCASKIRVPDTAAGKKGKCPKCSTVLVIPAAGLSLPDMPALVPLHPEPDLPEVDVKEAPPVAEARTAYASSVPPPIPSAPTPALRASRRDEDEKPSRSRRDDDDSDEPRRSRRDDDDFDEPRRSRDDGLNIRRPKRKASIGMSVTAMVLGITGLVITLGSIAAAFFLTMMCPCLMVGGYAGFLISGILGLMGIIFGVIGLKQGGPGFAWTGIGTGAVNLLIILIVIVLTLIGVVALGALFGAAANQQQQQQQQLFGPQQNFRPPPNFGPPPKIGPPPMPRR